MVLALHDSLQALGLFRSAIDEAMGRCLRLVVLDYGSVPLHDLLRNSEDLDPRERKALRALWANPHVRVIRAKDLDAGIIEAVEYCESHEASLLIVAAEVLASLASDPDLAPRIFSAEFDLLIVTERQETSRTDRSVEPSDDLAEPAANGK